MIIKEVELENIRSHKHTKLSFPQGSVLLWGDVGAGKSTILYSIDYALFGSSSEIKGDGILRKGSMRGKIKVNFSVGKNNVIIERILEKSGNAIRDKDCYITINGYREKISPTSLKAKVFKLLGYPLSFYSLRKIVPFRYTVYVPQERMKEILSSNPAERLKLLRGFFNVEKYQRIIENSKNLKSLLRERNSEKEGKLHVMRRYKDEKEKLLKTKGDLLQELKNHESKMEKMRKEIDAINLLKEKLFNLKEKAALVDNRKEDLKNRISIMEKEISLKEAFLKKVTLSSKYSQRYLDVINNDAIDEASKIKEDIDKEEVSLSLIHI